MNESMAYSFSKHALIVMERRSIPENWIKQVFENPETKEMDPRDPTVTRYFGKIAENENRVLRLSVNFNKKPPLIISAHFDRSMKGKI